MSRPDRSFQEALRRIVIRTVPLINDTISLLRRKTDGEREDGRELGRRVGRMRIRRDIGDIRGKREDGVMDGTLQRKTTSVFNQCFLIMAFASNLIHNIAVWVKA